MVEVNERLVGILKRAGHEKAVDMDELLKREALDVIGELSFCSSGLVDIPIGHGRHGAIGAFSDSAHHALSFLEVCLPVCPKTKLTSKRNVTLQYIDCKMGDWMLRWPDLAACRANRVWV